MTAPSSRNEYIPDSIFVQSPPAKHNVIQLDILLHSLILQTPSSYRYQYDIHTVRNWVQQILDSNHDGRLSKDEVQHNLKRILDSGERH